MTAAYRTGHWHEQVEAHREEHVAAAAEVDALHEELYSTLAEVAKHRVDITHLEGMAGMQHRVLNWALSLPNSACDV